MTRPGSATPEGTARYASRFPGAGAGHFRGAGDLTVSGLGIGTYLGSADAATDRAFEDAVARSVAGGINVVDTAINYRFQRSERNVGAALRRVAAEGFARDEIVICTKGGFIPYDGLPPTSPGEAAAYIKSRYIDRDIAALEDFHQLSHCLEPRFLEDQIAASRKNLGVDVIDVYYLHNPEIQLPALGRERFLDLLERDFALLEREVSLGRIAAYGLATWEGLRAPEDSKSWLDLEAIVRAAEKTGGARHHFRWIQLPYSLGLSEARRVRNHRGGTQTVLEAAGSLGLSVAGSASLYQGRLAANLPEQVAAAFPEVDRDDRRALQFARSTAGITTALVGMADPHHVTANLGLTAVPVAEPGTVGRLLAT
jgi:aryl-alcohol dehydrogenase-like predicted oxidoreductase